MRWKVLIALVVTVDGHDTYDRHDGMFDACSTEPLKVEPPLLGAQAKGMFHFACTVSRHTQLVVVERLLRERLFYAISRRIAIQRSFQALDRCDCGATGTLALWVGPEQTAIVCEYLVEISLKTALPRKFDPSKISAILTKFPPGNK